MRRTVEFVQIAERCGVSAVAVHGRTRDQRDHHAADWRQIAACKAAVQIPVVLNGDVFCFGDFERAIKETGVDSVMSARGALANASIFAPLREDVLDVVRKYAVKAVALRNNYQNTKWVVLRMLAGVSRKEKTHKDLIATITNCRIDEVMLAALQQPAEAPEADLKRARKERL